MESTTGFSVKNAIKAILLLFLIQFIFFFIASSLVTVKLITKPSPLITGALVIVTYGTIVAVVYYFAWRSSAFPWKALGLRRFPVGKLLLFVSSGILAIMTASFLYVLFLQLLGINSPDQSKQIISMFGKSIFGLIVTFVVVVLIAPFAEELLFRGYLYPSFRNNWGISRATVATSFLFALAHLQALILLPVYFFIGFVLTFVREKTNSVIPSMILHGLNNFLFFLVMVNIAR